jgi:citrate synthase
VSNDRDSIHTRIWREVAAPDNAFAAQKCWCAGYDVYGDLLRKATWIEYLFLLLRGERPTRTQAALLETLPRDASVSAAMNGGVAGSTYASCLMAALAAGAGQLGGAHEVALAMRLWAKAGMQLEAWQDALRNPPQDERLDIWQPMEHAPGFDPHGSSCALPVRQTLEYLAQTGAKDTELVWLLRHRPALEAAAQAPLSMSGVAAAALRQLGFSESQGEMLYLLLRLPGAAAHALEQEDNGVNKYPFFRDALQVMNDPGPHASTERAQ